MIVVDASAVFESLFVTEYSARIRERLFAEGETLHAPHLLDIEVAHALRKHQLSGQISSEIGMNALEDFANLHVTRYPHKLFLTRIWELRQNVTAYDAMYVALAEALDAPLLTHDRALARSSGHDAQIELI